MIQKMLVAGMAALALFALSGCGGSGSAGLNGAVTLDAHVEGTTVVGTVTYTNPNKSNLIGTEITLSTSRPDIFGGLPPIHTNNSGSVNFIFGPAVNFDSTQTFTVTATTGSLQDFSANLQMTGRAIAITPPANQTLSVAFADADFTKTIVLDTTPFVTVRDPIGGNISAHTVTITTVVTSTPGSDPNLAAPATVTTNSSGVASLVGTTMTVKPPAPGQSAVITITWTATDTLTGLSASGTTTVTLNRAAS